MSATCASPTFASLLHDFFCQRLTAQSNASPCTIASYRDTFRLLLRFVQDQSHGSLATLTLADLDAPIVLGFLDHLERERHNSIRSRNARLTALRSFFHYAASRDPAQLPVVQRVLAIPRKRHDRPVLGFLQAAEMEAVQAATNLSTWSGRRDHVLLATMYNTGARVSEAIGLHASDFAAGPREGSQGASRSAVEVDDALVVRVARRQPRTSRPASIPKPRWTAPDSLGRSVPPAAGSAEGCRRRSLAAWPQDLAAHASSHHGDAPSPGRG